ncbi:hypothetical protein Taro_018768 [Colocasia esculenta]|uniref:Uncharacterized protein n=1 Tax=Colocasia esculenta TaxID=4460 RepID=A0A843UJF9_COLES|nr:hypothetical protein [Colocasia esculenta]
MRIFHKLSTSILKSKASLPSIQALSSLHSGVVPFGCEGRPGGVSRVLFPSVVKEDLVRYPGCCSLRVKEDQLGCWVL